MDYAPAELAPDELRTMRWTRYAVLYGFWGAILVTASAVMETPYHTGFVVSAGILAALMFWCMGQLNRLNVGPKTRREIRGIFFSAFICGCVVGWQLGLVAHP